ncbi:MAG: hypothetical protein AAF919_16220 [Pseudomonadota bacterium]
MTSGADTSEPSVGGPDAEAAAAASGLTLVVQGWVGMAAEPQLIVEKEGRPAHDISGSRDEGWGDTQYRTDIPNLPNWRHLTRSVLDFDRLHELGAAFSVRPGGHAYMPDFWNFGTNFPVVSRRLRTMLEDAFPEGSYFFHCPVHERLVEAEPQGLKEGQIAHTERLRGGPFGDDAPQDYSFWVVRNTMSFIKPEGWKKPRDILPKHPTTKSTYAMTADPAAQAYMATMPFCCFLPDQVFFQRTLYDRIRTEGMTGFHEMRGRTINMGENTAHV